MTERKAPGGNAFLVAVLEQLADAAVAIDGGGRIVIVNGAAERLLGCSRAALLGAGFVDRLPGLAEMISAEDGETLEAAIERPGADGLFVEAMASRLSLANEPILLLTLRDVSKAIAVRRGFDLHELVSDETERVVIVADADRRLILVNNAFTRMFGYSRDEALGRPAAELFMGRHASAETMRHLKARLDEGKSFNEKLFIRDANGRSLWVQMGITPIFDEAGRLRNVVGLISNLTESLQMQELQREVLQAVAEDQPLRGVMELICERVEAVAPEVICSIHHVDEERRLSRLAAPSLPVPVASLMDRLPIGPNAAVCGIAAFRGESLIVEDIATDPLCAEAREVMIGAGIRACWSNPIKLKDGRVVGTFAFHYREARRPSAWHEQIAATCLHLAMLAIERHASKEHIARLAYHDVLTGLPNRKQLRDIFRERSGAAEGSRRFAFLCLDIDRFKDVNDTLGHATGDRLLVEIGRRLARQLGPQDLLGRYGGDEFIIVLADYDTAAASAFAAKLLEQLRAPVAIEDLLLPVSASIGIGIYPEDGSNEETLFKHADTAMYEAKNAGGGTFRFFRPEMNRLAEERLVLGAALREAIDRGQFRLHYQPQVCCRTGALAGAEALARWRHPLLGDVSPGRFIPVAEELGLIEQIGRWALDEACRQLAAWHRSGLMLEAVSVNLSAKHFRNPALTGFIADTLARYGLKPPMLTVEITEGVIMDANPVAIETAKAIHALGVKLSLDDFGTGYSSLSYLARLPIDELKIDRGFMLELERDRNAQAVVTAVVRIGQSLSLKVVAEGVETLAQHCFIDGLGCDLVQGFLVSRPLAPNDFEAWLRSYRPEPLVRLPGAA